MKNNLWNYILIDFEPVELKRRTKCFVCDSVLLKGETVRRVFYAAAYYTRTRTACLKCSIPEEIEQ